MQSRLYAWSNGFDPCLTAHGTPDNVGMLALRFRLCGTRRGADTVFDQPNTVQHGDDAQAAKIGGHIQTKRAGSTPEYSASVPSVDQYGC